MSDIEIVPAGNEKIVICHWDADAGQWQSIEINHNALNGHDNHDYDVWPPVEEVTEGSNWPTGEDMYLNGCVLVAEITPTPSPEPSPTGTLPPTGATENMGVLGLVLIGAGAWMKLKSRRRSS